MTDCPASPTPVWLGWLQRHWGLITVAIVLALVATVRIRLRDFPLERDEGEYAYAGQLMLQGIPPYKLAYNMKFPGAYAMHAGIMAVFGQSPAGIHLGLTCVTTLTALMVYGFGRRHLDELAGVVAAVTCAVLSACPSLLGLASHATHFASLFATAGFCLLWPAPLDRSGWRRFTGGLLFGLAVLMKQHAAIVSLWMLGMLAASGIRQKMVWSRVATAAATFSLGVIVPFGLACMLLWRAGVFESFWFWTFSYAREYVTEMRLEDVPEAFRLGLAGVTARCTLLWLTALAGLVLIWYDRRARSLRAGLAGLFVATFLTTCPGFYFRNHYFLMMVPALSWLAGCAVSSARLWLLSNRNTVWFDTWPALTYGLFVAVGVTQNANIWFAPSPQLACWRVYGANPFSEAETVSAFIRDHSATTDRVAVLGSEPEIYFLSRRHSASGYIYTFALVELHPYARRMQEEMIREIESSKPRYIVLATANSSWWGTVQSEKLLALWWSQSYRANYALVGAVEFGSAEKSRYLWGEEARGYVVNGRTALLIYQRRSG
jgi:hypothetical protein